MIDTAVILAAGMGTRLAPLTRSVPKCLVKVNGTPILKNALARLSDRGVTQAVILVGHMEEMIRSRFGKRFRGIDIRYVRNPLFQKTNNMYSLWLAGQFCPAGKGFLLIEGDLFFEADVLDRLMADPAGCCWAADDFIRFRDGCMLTAGSDRRVSGIDIIRTSLPSYNTTQYKSAGMLKIDGGTAPTLWDCLEFEVRHWHLDLYYDQVLARHLGEFDLNICPVNGFKWMEIDDARDLEQAEAIF